MALCSVVWGISSVQTRYTLLSLATTRRRRQPSSSGRLAEMSDGFQPAVDMALDVDDLNNGPGLISHGRI
ncbi:hypothetical protein RRF57_009988 [Xylaria bambusicola]|uniref:Uncharacterized protein n=1 Tax=Xylaria bambusicola TaxID=326684 RepID=A0AAN7V089_9PEZI